MKSRTSKSDDADNDETGSTGSTGSPHSLRKCNVRISRADLSAFENENIAHNTRGRKSSHLKAENLAALPSTDAKRSNKAKSEVSDDTNVSATSVTRRASARLAVAPKTPKKETAPKTPKKETASRATSARRNCKISATISFPT